MASDMEGMELRVINSSAKDVGRAVNQTAEELANMRKFVQENFTMHSSPEETVPTTCYGKIDFEETTTKDLPHFIRCSDNTDPAALFTLFTDHWKAEKPGVLISFTGASIALDLDPRIKNDLIGGISRVATKLHAWVISGGINTGVMNLLSEAFYGTRNVCVGFVPWGLVAKRETLTKAKSGNVFSYRLGSHLVQKKQEAILDYNHTHFVLVDDGSDGVWRREIEFRGHFQKHIIEKSGQQEVPSLLLLINGGQAALETVLHVAVENGTPCVLFEGTRGAADWLIYALKRADEILQAEEYNKPHEGLIDEITRTLDAFLSTYNVFSPKERNKKILIYKELVIGCIRRREIFTIANVRTGMSTENAILSAILKSTKSITSTYEQMRLAILWDVAEFAEIQILSQIYSWKPQVAGDGERELQQLLIMSLALNRMDFVKLFNSYGVSIKSLLTKGVLQFLYAFRLDMGVSTMHREVEPTDSCSVSNPKFLKSLLQYKDKERNSTGKVMEVRLEVIEHTLFTLLATVSETTVIPESDSCTFEFPYHHLFIWALLNNMHDMSLLLWEFQEDPIAHALIAAEITNGLLKRARDNDLQAKIMQSLQTTRNTYQQLSIDLVDECYKTDEANTKVLTVRQLNYEINTRQPGTDDQTAPDKQTLISRPLYRVLEKHSCLSLAVASADPFPTNFVSHQVVQDILDDVWTLPISRRTIKVYEVLMYIFLPFLLYKEDIVLKEGSRSMRQNGGAMKAIGRFFRKVFYFHFYSPVVRFYVHTIGYIMFLMLFAYVATLEKKSTTPGGLEILLIVTVFGFAVSEFGQIYLRAEPSTSLKFAAYIRSIWNKFDCLCLFIFLIALVLRCIETTLQIGHLFYAFDVSLWILRSINILYISPVIGPWVLMIGQMFFDLLNFLTILLVFMLSYGIAWKAILAPTPDDSQMSVASIFRPYFHIHGEYFLDKPEDNNTTWFGTAIRNSYAEPIGLVYLGAYLLIANVLLLNLVIAIFNSTYEKILGSAEHLWRFHRYEIVQEYAYRRSVLCPPLSLIENLFQLLKWLCCFCKRKCVYKPRCYKGLMRDVVIDESEVQLLRELEGNCLIKLVRRRKENETEVVDVEKLQENMENLHLHQQQASEDSLRNHFQEYEETQKITNQQVTTMIQQMQDSIRENSMLLKELLQKTNVVDAADEEKTSCGWKEL